MATNIGKAYVQIVPSAQGISGSISSILNGEADSAGKQAGSSIASGVGSVLKSSAAVVGAGLAAATTGAMALVKSAVSNFADYEQLIGGVETLFKDSAGIVEGYADNAYKTAGLSANAYMETVTGFSASLLQSLGGDTAKAAEVGNMAVIDMADNANKMGTSMESIQTAYQGFAKQNYTMLDNLKLGYGGTKSEMERLLEDATKLTGIKYDINNLSDVYNAIHAIQENLGITGTTALEAERTISGSISAMGAAWSNLVTGIARGDADIGELVGNFVTSVQTVAENIIPVILQSLEGLGQLIEGITPMLSDMLPGLVESILPPLLNAATSLLTAFGTALVDNLPLLIDTALTVVSGFVSFLVDNIPALIDGATTLFVGLVSGLVDAIPKLIPAAIEIVTSLVQDLIDHIDLLVDAAIELVSALAIGLVDNLPLLLSAAWDLLVGIVYAFIEHAPEMWEAGKSLVEGLWDGIKNAAGWLWDHISGWARGLLQDVKGVFGIHSPSTVFAEFGEMMMAGLGEGIEENAGIVSDAMSGISNLITDEMTASVEMDASAAARSGMLSAAMPASVPESGSQIALMEEQIALLKELVQKSGVYLDGKLLSNSIGRYSRAMGV